MKNIKTYLTFQMKESMSKIPTEPSDDKNNDKQILRSAIISELDAISLYEQFAANTKDEKLKEILLDVAREEKTHIGEFEAYLLKIDNEQKIELEKGKSEIEEK